MSAKISKSRLLSGTLLVLAAAVLIILSSIRSPVPASQYASARIVVPTISEIAMPDGTVAVNHADAEDLLLLDGVGETLADAILRERELHGPFYFPEDLIAVRGIGPAKLQRFRSQLDLDP